MIFKLRICNLLVQTTTSVGPTNNKTHCSKLQAHHSPRWPLVPTDRSLQGTGASLLGLERRLNGDPSAHHQGCLSGFLTVLVQKKKKKDVKSALCFNLTHPKQQSLPQTEGKPSISSYSVSRELMLQKVFKRGQN